MKKFLTVLGMLAVLACSQGCASPKPQTHKLADWGEWNDTDDEHPDVKDEPEWQSREESEEFGQY